MENQELNIVIVEDNEDDAELVIRSFKKKKLVNKIIHLSDGAEALDYIYGMGSYAELRPDYRLMVVLLDLNMPRVNGLEVLQKIKEDPTTQNIPVIVLASSEEDPNIKKSYNLGANSYIVKPVNFENFTKTTGELGLSWKVAQ